MENIQQDLQPNQSVKVKGIYFYIFLYIYQQLLSVCKILSGHFIMTITRYSQLHL